MSAAAAAAAAADFVYLSVCRQETERAGRVGCTVDRQARQVLCWSSADVVVVALIVLYTYGKSVNCHVQSSRIADSLRCTLHPSSPVYYAIHIGLLVCITRSVSASADRVAAVKLHEQ